MQSTITSKGQVTVPKAVRDKLNLQAGDKLEFIIEDGDGVRVVPVTAPLAKLKGMVPAPAKAVTLDEMDAAVRREASKR
jgi:AbrB family looped-hinge helix DNA binding protein